MIFGELSIVKLQNLTFGFNYGSLPMDSITNRVVDMDQITAPITVSDGVTLTPSPSSSIRTYSAFLRYFPWNESMYFQTSLMGLSLRGSVSGTVTNSSTGRYITSVSASLGFRMPMIGFNAGWQLFVTDSAFFDIGLGFVYIMNPSKSFSLSGIDLAAYDETLYEDIQREQQNLSNRIDGILEDFTKKIRILPAFFFSFGVAF
ncbi:MAG: hypothetical protein JXA66_06650 [Oligoflexia bacterium]|nr:hypothetical protein [Oligoflexia bacterium]